MGTRLLVLSTLAVGLLLAVACGGDGGIPEPERLVPQGSTIMVQIQVDTLLLDTDIARLYETLPADEDQPATFQALLDLAEDEIGIDLRDFSSVLLFGDVSQFEEEGGLIVKGTFQEQELLDAIQQAAEVEFSATEYSGYQVHTSLEDEPAELVFLDEETLLFGTKGMARQVIDIAEGDADPISGGVYDTYTSLGDVLIKVAFQLPPEALAEIEETPTDFPFDLSSLTDIQAVGIAIDKTESDLSAQVTLEFASEISATAFSNVVNGAVLLARGLLSDETFLGLLNRLEISAEGTTVTAAYQISVEELEEAIQELDIGDIFGFPGNGVESAQAAEWDNIQVAIDAYMADQGLAALPAADANNTLLGSSSNDFTAATGVLDLETGGYLRTSTSTYYYCWDTTGRVTAQDTAATVDCTRSNTAVAERIIIVTGPGRQMPIQSFRHIQPGEPHEPYTTSPPTSGPHYASTASWGISKEPIPDELQVHNLEHGGVLIQYNSQDVGLIFRLEALAQGLPNYPCFIIVAPYPDLADNTIALTAWGVIQEVESLNGGSVFRAILNFVNYYGGQGPEQVACAVLEEPVPAATQPAATPTSTENPALPPPDVAVPAAPTATATATATAS